ncbi:unnamed protein product [Diamesa tonsa]
MENTDVSMPENVIDDKDKVLPVKQRKHRKKQMYISLKKQMEFYLGDANLQKDRFLSKLIQEDSFIPIETFLSFNKIKQMLDPHGVNDPIDIVKAIANSELLELSEDNKSVRRKVEFKPKSADEIDNCTLYVEHLPNNADQQFVENLFSKYGKVTYVSLPRYKKSKKIKQFGFVEFEAPESVEKTLNAFKKFDGVLVYSSLKPDSLLSITTFEKDVEESAEPPTKRMKIQEPEETLPVSVLEETETKPLEEKIETLMVQDSKEESDGTDNENETEVPEETEMKEEKLPIEVNDETKPKEEDEVPKKKIRKHKKKSSAQKDVQDERIFAMKIMKKKEWKKLRGTYLNLERTKAKEIKKLLREAYNKRNNNKTPSSSHKSPVAIKASPHISFYGSPKDQDEVVEKITVAEVPEQRPRQQTLTFIPGAIVNIKFREPCVDFKEFKKEMRQFSYVQYVECPEGDFQSFIRCDSATSAQELASQYTSCEYDTEILKEEVETQYWNKIFEARNKTGKPKGSNPSEAPPPARRRGREKLLKKIVKSAQHIKFDDADEIAE